VNPLSSPDSVQSEKRPFPTNLWDGRFLVPLSVLRVD